MQKSHKYKGKTAALPHRVMNKVALSMIPMHKVETKGFLGFTGSVSIKEGTITLKANSNITAHDMRMFNFVLSQWQAMRKKEDSDILYVDIDQVLQALEIRNRTENRHKVISHLQRMIGLTITYDYGKGSIAFSTLDFVRVENHNAVSIRVSKTFEETVLQAKQRFINVDMGMKLRGSYSIELFNLLQIAGSGVNYKVGTPMPVNSILHKRVCEYLLLDPIKKASLEEVRRAFKNLEQIGMPKYKKRKIGKDIIWVQEGKNISQNTLKALEL